MYGKCSWNREKGIESIIYYVSENGDRMLLLDLQGKNGGMAYVTISSISHPELKLSFVAVLN